MGRLLFVLALYLFFEHISKSYQVAGLATMVYMLNPHFMFFNSMYAYQTIGLVFTAFALLIMAWTNGTRQPSLGSFFVFLLAAFSVVISHHITSYVLALILIVWIAVSIVTRLAWRTVVAQFLRVAAVGLMIFAWLTFIAPETPDYVLREAGGREETTSQTEEKQELIDRLPQGPIAERVLNIGTVGIIAACLPLAVWFVWRRYRHDAPAIGFGLGAFLYYGIIGVRLTSGPELAGRSWAFMFLATGFALAVGMLELQRSIREEDFSWIPDRILGAKLPFANLIFGVVKSDFVRDWIQYGLLAILTLMVVGGIAGGWPPYWGRLPGPFMVEASERSIEPQGETAAWWTRKYLGENIRIAANYTNYYLLG
jgi:hypothetical protein